MQKFGKFCLENANSWHFDVEISLAKGIIFRKIGLANGAILKQWAAHPCPKFSREPPPPVVVLKMDSCTTKRNKRNTHMLYDCRDTDGFLEVHLVWIHLIHQNLWPCVGNNIDSRDNRFVCGDPAPLRKETFVGRNFHEWERTRNFRN